MLGADVAVAERAVGAGQRELAVLVLAVERQERGPTVAVAKATPTPKTN